MLDCDPGWPGTGHDHADEGQKEVSVLVEGDATVTVGGEDVRMEAGDVLRIPPDAARRIDNGESESRFVCVSRSVDVRIFSRSRTPPR